MIFCPQLELLDHGSKLLFVLRNFLGKLVSLRERLFLGTCYVLDALRRFEPLAEQVSSSTVFPGNSELPFI